MKTDLVGHLQYALEDYDELELKVSQTMDDFQEQDTRAVYQAEAYDGSLKATITVEFHDESRLSDEPPVSHTQRILDRLTDPRFKSTIKGWLEYEKQQGDAADKEVQAAEEQGQPNKYAERRRAFHGGWKMAIEAFLELMNGDRKFDGPKAFDHKGECDLTENHMRRWAEGAETHPGEPTGTEQEEDEQAGF